MMTVDELFVTNNKYRGFSLRIYQEVDVKNIGSTYHCIASNEGKLEQVRDPNGILQVIRHEPDRIEFTISSDDIIGNTAYDSNPALAVIDVFHFKVDEFLNEQEAEKPLAKMFSITKTYHCSCCGTTYTTDQLGYTPTCRNCGALMKEPV